jgi:hypothetical protein
MDDAVQGEHRRSHWRCFSEAMAASPPWSQAAVSGQRHVGAAQARHTKDPAGGDHHRQLARAIARSISSPPPPTRRNPTPMHYSLLSRM